MENRINQVVKLDNGENYVLLRQVVYKSDSYFIASKLDDSGFPMPDEILFFHQIDINGQLKFEEVKDIELMKFLYTYMPL